MTFSETHVRVNELLIHEADLLDDRKFEDWKALFTAEGTYWVPLDPAKDPKRQWSLVYDTPLRLEERVYHLTDVPFPSQRPESRTLHLIGNVRVTSESSTTVSAVSNQIIYEIRVGDFRQVGLGEQRSFAARVEHELVSDGDDLRIAKKTVYLVNRGTPIGNLTFLL